MVGHSAEGPAVALGYLAAFDGLLNRRCEFQEPERVGDRGPSATHAMRDLLVRQPELVDQSLERARLLHRVEIGALQVLDQRPGELLALGRRPHDGRNPLQAGHLGRPQTSLAGDQAIPGRVSG